MQIDEMTGKDYKELHSKTKQYLKGTLVWSGGTRTVDLTQEEEDVKKVQIFHKSWTKTCENCQKYVQNPKKIRNMLRKRRLFRENPENYANHYKKA